MGTYPSYTALEYWHTFFSLASSPGVPASSFTGYSWRWRRPWNETLVMWNVCKWI